MAFDQKAYAKSWYAGRRQRWIAEGLCSICGKCPPEEGKVNCRPCLDIANSRSSKFHKTVDGRFTHYKYRAHKACLSFTLPFRLFEDLVTDNCFYCGEPPDPLNGIDRLDSNLGYDQGNCVTACGTCNIAKNVQSKESFERWILKAANHLHSVGVTA